MLRAVREFHEKIGACVGERLGEGVREDAVSHDLVDSAVDLRVVAENTLRCFKKHSCADHRALRAHLIAEEFGELLEAMSTLDELATLDALADLLYVVVGTAVTFGLPLDEAFAEVHRSNMTKIPQVSDPDRARVRDKGPDYSPPDLARVLRDHRV